MDTLDHINLADTGEQSMTPERSEPSLAETGNENGFLWIKSTSNDLKGKKVGEYEITGIIGEGGMGYVLKGIQPYIKKKVAIKVLKPDLTVNEQATNRFLAEAQAVNAIGHPNIIDIFSFGKFKEGLHYFVMEFLDGQTFGEYLDDVKIVPYEEALHILEDIFDALKSAHKKGIIHRDLKPDNIFLLKRKGRFFVKILDFGLAKISEEGIATAHTKSGVPVGTPLYMSPEQCMGENVDQRADIYALGIILYKMFTGQVPFKEGSFLTIITSHLVQEPFPPSKLASVPDALERIILKALQKEKENRQQTVEELENELLPLLRALSKESTSEQPEPIEGVVVPEINPLHITRLASQVSSAPSQSGGGFKIAFFVLLGVLVLGGAGVGGWIFFQRSKQQVPTEPMRQFSESVPLKPALFVPPVMKKVIPVPVMKPMQQKVFVNINLEPSKVAAEIWVDGKKLKRRFFKIEKSEKRSLKILVKARGYFPVTKTIIPAFSQNINFQLHARGSGTKRPMTGMKKDDLPDVL